MPSNSTGIVSPSSFAQSHRTGRENRSPSPFHHIDFENERPRTISASREGSTARSSSPGTTTPTVPSRCSSASTATPCLRANPSAAFVGLPSSPKATESGGPFTHSSGVRSGRSGTRTASRRGPRYRSLGAASRSRRQSSGSCTFASSHAEAGSSSQPISNSSVGIGLRRSCVGVGRALALPCQPHLRDGAGEVPDAADVGGALGHRDRPARVEQVERVRRLEHLVVCRERQVALEQRTGLGLVVLEVACQDLRSTPPRSCRPRTRARSRGRAPPTSRRAPTRARRPSACSAAPSRAGRGRT